MKRLTRHKAGLVLAILLVTVSAQAAFSEAPGHEVTTAETEILTDAEWSKKVDALQGQADATRTLWKKLLPLLYRNIALSEAQVAEVEKQLQGILTQREKVDGLRKDLEQAREAKDAAQIEAIQTELEQSGARLRPVDRMATLRSSLTAAQRKTFDMNRAVAITRLRRNEI